MPDTAARDLARSRDGGENAMIDFWFSIGSTYRDVAKRVAVLAATEGWAADYARATYRRWFEEGLEPGTDPNLSDTLREPGHDPALVPARADGDEIGAAYEAATAEARTLGIFGSPTFVVDKELFWGDDRLDDALAWHRHGTLAR